MECRYSAMCTLHYDLWWYVPAELSLLTILSSEKVIFLNCIVFSHL